MAAGRLSTPIAVSRRGAEGEDKYGRGTAGELEVVDGLDQEWAGLTPKQGGEVSLAARLEGRQAYELLVRRNPATATITAADRITTLDDLALELDVTAAAPYQPDPSYILITATAGTPHG